MELKDNKILRVGFGGIPIQRLSVKEAVDIILYAFSKGINFIDTARGYTDSEIKIGKALEKWNKDVFIATKSMARTYEEMNRDINISLRNLKTDFIDLYQIHSINNEKDSELVLNEKDGAIRSLFEAKEEKKIKYIGISGHKPNILVKALKSEYFDSVQVPHNILERDCEKELIPLAKDMNISVLAMKPAAGGALKRVDLNLRFILNNGSDIALVGMDEKGHIDDNLSILPNIKSLNEQEMCLLNEEKDLWKGEFCRRCEYCMPCPQGLNIPFLLLLIAYWERYDLKDWVLSRLSSQKKAYADCIECRVCESRCPYQLKITDMMKKGIHLIK